jgi:Phage minor capsid protein 2
LPVPDDRVDELVDAVTGIYDDAELAVLRLITARLERGLGAADWQQRRLAEIGQLRTALQSIAGRLSVQGPGTAREAVTQGWRSGSEHAITDIAATARVPQPNPHAVQALSDAIVGELRPLHSQILPQATSAYRRAIAAAAGRKTTGVASTRRAAQAAWATLVDEGIVTFTDKAGRGWRLHTYVEMATRTAVSRAIDRGVLDACRATGNRLVYVTDRPQECHLCRIYEHKVLVIDDGPVVAPAIGTLTAARRAGLGHPNCRHQIAPWTTRTRLRPGRADPEGDAARQHQRYLERQARHWREREASALTDEARRAARVKVKTWDQALGRHIAATGLSRKVHREHPGAGYAAPPTRRHDTLS